MHYYFAYGSNLDEAQMKTRCPDYVFIGKAVLKDYQIAFTTYSKKRECGCADIMPMKGQDVWGVVYVLSGKDLDALDKSEGSNYRRIEVTVIDEKGEGRKVLVYVVINKRFDLKPSKGYLGLIIGGAKEFDFPTDYTDRLTKELTLD